MFTAILYQLRGSNMNIIGYIIAGFFYTSLVFGAGFYTNCSSSKSIRVDETKNKALENLSNWGAVVMLIRAKEIDSAWFISCIISEAVKKSDANKCDKMIVHRINKESKVYSKKSLVQCLKNGKLQTLDCLNSL